MDDSIRQALIFLDSSDDADERPLSFTLLYINARPFNFCRVLEGRYCLPIYSSVSIVYDRLSREKFCAGKREEEERRQSGPCCEFPGFADVHLCSEQQTSIFFLTNASIYILFIFWNIRRQKFIYTYIREIVSPSQVMYRLNCLQIKYKIPFFVVRGF